MDTLNPDVIPLWWAIPAMLIFWGILGYLWWKDWWEQNRPRPILWIRNQQGDWVPILDKQDKRVNR